jgi:hypothetical protein
LKAHLPQQRLVVFQVPVLGDLAVGNPVQVEGLEIRRPGPAC